MTALELHDWFNADYEAGILYWKKASRKPFLVGKVAGYRCTDGYWKVKLQQRKHVRAVLIWSMFHKRWPQPGFHIDHRDNEKWDDGINNLQELSFRDNIYRGFQIHYYGVIWQ